MRDRGYPSKGNPVTALPRVPAGPAPGARGIPVVVEPGAAEAKVRGRCGHFNGAGDPCDCNVEDTGPTEPMYKGWEHFINAEGYISEAFGLWDDDRGRAMFLLQAAQVHALLANAGAQLGWHR